MQTATMRLIELAERLTPSGEIGDGMVHQFHEAAALARLEQEPKRANKIVITHIDPPVRPAPFVVMDGGRCQHCGCPR